MKCLSLNKGGNIAGKKMIDCIKEKCREAGVGNVHCFAKLQVMKEPRLCSMCGLRGIGSSKFLV